MGYPPAFARMLRPAPCQQKAANSLDYVLTPTKSCLIAVITSSITGSQAVLDEVRTVYSVLTFCIAKPELKLTTLFVSVTIM